MPTFPSSPQNRHQRLSPQANRKSPLKVAIACALAVSTTLAVAQRAPSSSLSSAKAPATSPISKALQDYLPGLPPEKAADPVAVAAAISAEHGSFAALVSLSAGFSAEMFNLSELAQARYVHKNSSHTCQTPGEPFLVVKSLTLGKVSISPAMSFLDELPLGSLNVNRHVAYLSTDAGKSGMTVSFTGDLFDKRWLTPTVVAPSKGPANWSAIRGARPLLTSENKPRSRPCQLLPRAQLPELVSALESDKLEWVWKTADGQKVKLDKKSPPANAPKPAKAAWSISLPAQSTTQALQLHDSLVQDIVHKSSVQPWSDFQLSEKLLNANSASDEQSRRMTLFRFDDNHDLIILTRVLKDRLNSFVGFQKSRY